MAVVADFCTFILGAFTGEEDGRVSLYHFLKNFYSPDAQVTPEIINDFFSETLHITHWQEKKSVLYAQVKEALQRFFSQSNDPFRLDQIWDLSRLQLVPIGYCENLSKIIAEQEEILNQEGDKLKVIPEAEDRVLSIRRTSLGEVIIRTYSNWVRVVGSRLLPLCPDEEIFYDPGMELKAGAVQKLRPSQHSQVRFTVDAGPERSITAQFVNGFAFRQTQTLHLGGIQQEPRIFFPLKRLERFYVYRPSDPYYLELMSVLERSISMFQSRNEIAYEFARQAFDNGQIAFDQIFPDDKALYSRLRELARWISSETRAPHPTA